MYSDEEKIQLMKDFEKMNYYESQNFAYDDEFAIKLVDIVKRINLGTLSLDSDEVKQAVLDLEFNLYGQGIFLRRESKFFDEGFEIYLNVGLKSIQIEKLNEWLKDFDYQIYAQYENGFASINMLFTLKTDFDSL